MSYIAVRLTIKHNRKSFACGKQPLDNYIRTQVNQDIKKKLAACFVIAHKYGVVQGYYTLSNASVPTEDAPVNIRNKIPRGYTELPVTLLGRLAVDRESQGKRLGETLLMDALKRSYELSKTIASLAVIVDPMDAEAEAFYIKYGFTKLSSGKMFMPMKTIAMLMGS